MPMDASGARQAFVRGGDAGEMLISCMLRGVPFHLGPLDSDDPALKRKWIEGLVHGVVSKLMSESDPVQAANVKGIIFQVLGMLGIESLSGVWRVEAGFKEHGRTLEDCADQLDVVMGVER